MVVVYDVHSVHSSQATVVQREEGGGRRLCEQ